MTIYLAIDESRGEFFVKVQAFCSSQCRAFGRVLGSASEDDDEYEFDETCQKCGALIPAGRIDVDAYKKETK